MAFTLNDRTIGPGHPVFIIAEMSGNHNQSLDRALAIVGSSTLPVELPPKPCNARRLSSPPDDGTSKLSPSRQTPSGMAVAMP